MSSGNTSIKVSNYHSICSFYRNRLPHILLGGCIPVTVQVTLCFLQRARLSSQSLLPWEQEHVFQPFHDIIDYQEIGLTVRNQDIPGLLDILTAVSIEDIIKFRRNM